MGTPRPLDPIATLAGRYRLLRRIGAGARSEVFDAETLEGERVAVKVLAGTADEAERDRFRREARAAHQLRDPHVVSVDDYGVDEASGSAYLVMPRIEGQSLGELLAEQGALAPAVAVSIGVQIAKALAAAHAHGMIHRDVKPSNVLLAQDTDGRIRAMLCDFGMAKHQDTLDALTVSGELLGTPMYMAPEQATDAKRADERSDVWGLGATLCHALAGKPLLHAVRNPSEWFRALTSLPLPSLHDQAPWLDAGLVRVVHGMLIRDQARRCPTARDAMAALLDVQQGGGERMTRDSLRPLSNEDRSRRTLSVSLPTDWADVRVEGPASSPAAIGSRVDGRFELIREIGAGGMGCVFEGRTDDGRPVAIKLLRVDEHDAGKAAQRLLREARSANAVDSPHVVHVMEAGVDASTAQPYLVLELLRGPDLARVISEKGPLEPAVVVWVFVQLCSGLAAAHAKGLIHRDLKPSNIVLHEADDGQLIPKVCDFGIAKRSPMGMDSSPMSLTATGGMLGSPLYMSPEQAENPKNVGPRADVWSLCMSLYEALSGVHPWGSCSTVGEVLSALYTKDLPPLRSVAPWIDAELARTVHRGLQRAPQARFAHAGELGDALRRFAADHAPSATDIRATPLAPKERPRPSLVSRSDSYPQQPQQLGQPRAPSSRGLWVGLVAVAALGVALAGIWLRGAFTSSAEPAAAATSASSPTTAPVASTPVPVHGSLVVSPANVTVRVGGESVVVQDGRVSVSGAPGETLRVELELDGRRAEKTVIVTRDGALIPPAIDLDTEAPAPSPSATVAVSVRASPTATPAAPSATVPDTVAAPSAAPAEPRFKTHW